MKNTLQKVLRSPKFVIGTGIYAFLLLTIFIFPLVFPGDPLEMIGLGTFFKPGTYVSLYDSMDVPRVYTIRLDDAAAKRIGNKLSTDDRVAMKEWLIMIGLPEEAIDIEETEDLLQLWWNNFTEETNQGLDIISARRRFFVRLNNKLAGLFDSENLLVLQTDPETGEQSEKLEVSDTDYVNVGDVANVRTLVLGTDNFGRDMLKELVAAARVSIMIGLIAGSIATLIGLVLGLLAGYVGGLLDDFIMFFCNLFTVIPGFVLLILISYSIGQGQRGASTVAVVIGCTAWVWTARSVRSQVLSLRDRDHVSLSKLSGHSLPRIIVADILPYILSYVVMAFIVQMSSAILAEAQLSMLGLGPKTTEVPTLGLMMNWAMLYAAHTNGAWWAYYPVILTIALISFSLNLMNTGLDQVFNPQLRSN